MKKPDEYAAFDRTVRGLLKVSHAEIKSKLEEEKKQKKPKKSSASDREANGRA
jgi:hypothetical protein